LLGGDYGTPSPWPPETLALLRTLPRATWIRGNGERWLKEPPEEPPIVAKIYSQWLAESQFPQKEIDWLYSLPAQTEIDGVLYVHGSPLSDVDSFAPQPQDDEKRMLVGVKDKTIVFGHSHQQFQRIGPDGTYLVNPGSVGMPLDGDRRAAWAIRTPRGEFQFRRTNYDWHKAQKAWQKFGGPFGEMASKRIENGKD
jgi:diadenosine tetraphosphatase ApaH/serine/threonine PP2A family protein phosphatase